MLVQTGCLTVCANLLRPADLSYSFLSPWLAHYKRKFMNDHAAWRRSEAYVFYYGYYYAVEICIYAIVIVYASTVPLVAIAGMLYFMLRHLVDGLNLLTFNKKEIDSSSSLFSKIIVLFQCSILLLQLVMMSYLY